MRSSRRWSNGLILGDGPVVRYSEGCPINYIGGLSNELYRRVVQQGVLRDGPMV